MSKEEYKPMGYEKFILMAILKSGVISLNELEDNTIVFISSIWYNVHYGKTYNILGRLLLLLFRTRDHFYDRYYTWIRKEKKLKNITGTENYLIELGNKGLVKKIDGKYELTAEGKEAALGIVERLAKRAELIKNRLFKPSSAAINTTFVDGIMAFFKLSIGFITGSVGLISDGTDSATDTISAFLVWVGIKFRHESLSTLLVIILLFVASITVGFESLTRIYAALTSTIGPIVDPSYVIIIEGLAIFIYAGLYFYQRQVGRASGSLTLISQSVDSKNHIFIASSVVVGAIFSIFGIYYIDAIVGAVVAFRIFTDAVGLLKDEIHSMKGEETDLHKYKTPVGDYVQDGKMKAFRIWVIYDVWTRKVLTKEEIINSLDNMYTKTYIPVLSELNLIPEDKIGFNSEFDKIMEPLINRKFIREDGNNYHVTESGIKRFKHFNNLFHYYDVHYSDLLMLDVESET